MSNVIQFNVNSLIPKTCAAKTKVHYRSSQQQIQNSPQHIDYRLQKKHGLSFIQCFWGNDIARIESVISALRINLRCFSPKLVKDWIFIEAQKKKSDQCFAWVKKYGLAYKFVTIPAESDGMFLKMPLWNIGTQMATSDFLCYIDSDVCFSDIADLGRIEEAFRDYDILQLHSIVQDNEKTETSLAYQIMNSDGINFQYGNGGKTLGLRRSAYKMLKKFDATCYLDDQWFWGKVLGNEANTDKLLMLPYELDESNAGLPVRIGAPSVRITHIGHSESSATASYKLAHQLSYRNCKHGEDILYKDGKLPAWKTDSPIGRIMMKTFKAFFDGKADAAEFERNAEAEYGKIDKNHPLIVVTSFLKKTYRNKNSKSVTDFAEKLRHSISCEFHFVCISRRVIKDVDTIQSNITDEDKAIELAFSKKIHYPKNSTIVYISMQENIPEKLDFWCRPSKKLVLENGKISEK